MKQIKYIILGLLLISVSPACNKVLEVTPGVPLESNYFTSEAKVQGGIAGPYAKLVDIHGGYMSSGGPFFPVWLLPGDDITYQNASGSGAEFETFSGLNSSDGRIASVWQLYYQAITRCNFMLNMLSEPAIQAVFTTPGLKDNNVGEMLFLRSYCDLLLWDWFRKAPIQYDRITSMDSLYLPPSKGFDMLDFAIASLQKAIPLLPTAWPAGQGGRITKDGAYGLLVKCYVERACYNNKNAADYANAITAFQNISSSRQLVSQFGDNFDYRTENNTESLFELQATQLPNGANNPWLNGDAAGSSVTTGVYWNFWTNHWSNYTSGIAGPSEKLVKAFTPGDPRITETFRNTPDNLGGILSWIVPFNYFYGGNQIVKYVNGARGNCYDPNWQISSANNPRIIRLADVKLCAAEAYLATGNSTAALKQVNDIRTRARNSVPNGTPPSTVPANLSSVTMQNIMDERLLELAGEEGNRWTDLRRWHAAGYINLGNWAPADFGFTMNPSLFAFDVSKHLLFPIPISELNSNPQMAVSGNNPGY